ncbi:MAG TPA: hypothetical protein VFY74_07395, partial [Methyloceanibacter sp.]|nr:hypothetical protein [Methyloceanibacter sp.]
MLRIALSLLVLGFAGSVALAADEAQPPASEGAPAAQPPKEGAGAATAGKPLETARTAEKGSLESPYAG